MTDGWTFIDNHRVALPWKIQTEHKYEFKSLFYLNNIWLSDLQEFWTSSTFVQGNVVLHLNVTLYNKQNMDDK